MANKLGSARVVAADRMEIDPTICRPIAKSKWSGRKGTLIRDGVDTDSLLVLVITHHCTQFTRVSQSHARSLNILQPRFGPAPHKHVDTYTVWSCYPTCASGRG